MDDKLVNDASENNHLEHLKLIFQKIREAALELKLSAVHFFKKHLQYLGHLFHVRVYIYFKKWFKQYSA